MKLCFGATRVGFPEAFNTSDTRSLSPLFSRPHARDNLQRMFDSRANQFILSEGFTPDVFYSVTRVDLPDIKKGQFREGYHFEAYIPDPKKPDKKLLSQDLGSIALTDLYCPDWELLYKLQERLLTAVMNLQQDYRKLKKEKAQSQQRKLFEDPQT